MRATLLAIVAVAALGGCDKKFTEMVVVVRNGGVNVAADVDRLEVVVRNLTQGYEAVMLPPRPLCTESRTEDCQPLPLTMALVPGPSSPDDRIEVRVTARRGSVLAIDQAATFLFAKNRRQRLDFFLYSACLNVDCASNSSAQRACGIDGSCVELTPTELGDGALDGGYAGAAHDFAVPTPPVDLSMMTSPDIAKPPDMTIPDDMTVVMPPDMATPADMTMTAPPDMTDMTPAASPDMTDMTPLDPNLYVSPTGDDTGNPTCAMASPCRTIAHAATQASAGRTVILLDGTYDTVNQGATAAAIPAGVTLKAQNTGLAAVKIALTFAAGGSVVGLRIDRTAPNVAANAGFIASGGTLTLDAVDWKGSFEGFSGNSQGLRVMGTAIATLTPGTVTDYSAQTVALPSTAGVTPFISVENTAQLTIAGGTFGGPGLGRVPSTPNNGSGSAFLVRDQAKLTLNAVTLVFDTHGIAVLGQGELVLDNNSVLRASAATTYNGSALHLQNNGTSDGNVVKVTMSAGATITEMDAGNNAGAGMSVHNNSTRALVTLSNAIIERCGWAVRSNGELTLVATNSQIRNNRAGGIYYTSLSGNSTVDVTGGTISNNNDGAWAATAFYGGVHLASTSATYQVKLVGVTVSDNRSAVTNANTNWEGNSGLYLRGGASSMFELGTTANPGNNTIQNNSSGNMSGGITVRTASVTVNAVGNHFDANVQGADASGNYPTGGTVSSGSGANYRIVSGALKLSD